ncbi:unnamed protein product [Enterobius vermicularis]|uniref:EGF-like domain-containing protein n=1 Tax=Enterobius vermicularis TaxID=51028 RepID=A0A0N4V1U1_ENTVE|nr:unnamed protein product [Enterobius vermicularis]
MLLLLAVVIIGQAVAFSEVIFEPLPALNGSTRVVKAGLERRYVPLGRHFVFECEVLDIVYTNGYQVLDYAWVAIYGTLKRRTVLPRDPDDYTNLNSSLTDWRLLYKINWLGMLCKEATKDFMSVTFEPMTTRNGYTGTNLDCSDTDNISVNPLNPCAFGHCFVESLKYPFFIQYLTCRCVRQYTGEYCDILIEGGIYIELLHFSPFAIHMFSVVLLFIYGCCIQPRIWTSTKVSLCNTVTQVAPPGVHALYRIAFNNGLDFQVKMRRRPFKRNINELEWERWRERRVKRGRKAGGATPLSCFKNYYLRGFCCVVV